MIATLILAAAQAAAPVPPAPPAAKPGGQTIIREIVVNRDSDPKATTTDKAKQDRREIIVIRSDDRTAQDGPDRRVRIVDVTPGKGDERREIRILREPGAPGTRIAMLSCDDGAKVDSEATDKDGKKTRVMICAKGGDQIDALERASKRVAENKDIPEDVRTRLLGQVNAEIARRKSAK